MLPQVGMSGGTDAEEGKDRLEQDRKRADVGCLHEKRRNRVRQDVTEHDLARRRAKGDRRFDVGLLADGEDERAHQASDARNLGDGDRDDDGRQAGAPQRDDGDGNQDRRDRHDAVHYAHERAVEPADVAGGQSAQHAEENREQRRSESDDSDTRVP